MRERNKDIVGNIGELSKEIEEQDLEQINGGSDVDKLTVYSIPALPVCPPAPISNNTKITTLKSAGCNTCSAVFTVSAECLGGKKC